MIGKIAGAGLASLTWATTAMSQTSLDFTPENTAIVVVEFQKQWTEPGFPGIYHRMIRKQYNERSVYDHTDSFLSHARASGFSIIQAPLIIDPRNKQGAFAWLTMGTVFTKGRRRSEFTDGIVADSDLIVTGRYGFDGFLGSALEQALKSDGAENVLFCGFTTEHCVDMTMDAAEARGYSAWLVPECTATKNARLQSKTERKWEQKGRLLPIEVAVRELAQIDLE